MFKQTEHIGSGAWHQEKNDCTVRALMTLTGQTYELAHDLCSDYGRKSRRAMYTTALEHAMKSGDTLLECTFHERRTRGDRTVTLKRFIRENPVGRFYCTKRGHAFAVVDGQVIDTFNPRWGWRIKFAAQVLRKGEAAVVPDEKPAFEPGSTLHPSVRRRQVHHDLEEILNLGHVYTITEMAKMLGHTDQIWRDIQWVVKSGGRFEELPKEGRSKKFRYLGQRSV